MSRCRRHPIELPPGTRLADAVRRGIEAFDRGDAMGGDAAYREAVALVPADDPTLWSLLTADHVEGLRSLEHVTLALRRCDEYLGKSRAGLARLGDAGLRRCDEYLGKAGENHVPLRLVRAETRSLAGDRAGVDADLAAIRAAALTPEQDARRRRLEGLSAAMRRQFDEAKRHLAIARQAFDDLGDQCGVSTVDRDLARVDELSGTGVDDPPPEAVQDRLTRAHALRALWRFEEAITVLQPLVDRDLDPALRFLVLYELVVLHRFAADNVGAGRLVPLLYEAAEASANPAKLKAAERVAHPGALGADPNAPLGQELQRARRLIAEGGLEEAEHVIRAQREHAERSDEVAVLHLTAGELAFARGLLEPALDQLLFVARYATDPWLVHVRVRALRLAGDAYARRARALALAGEQTRVAADDRHAAECWAAAHRLEEQIAARQVSDTVRIRMLHAVPDEHDQRVGVAATALQQHGPDAAAMVVVAMEAARGATILGRILPEGDALVRDLPSPSDQPGAWQWVQRMSARFPRSQVAWLLHSTPDHVHHAVVGRGWHTHVAVPCERDELNSMIDALRSSCSQDFLETSVQAGHFDRFLANIAALIGIDAVIPSLPPHVRRIAVVAGGALSDIPLAALRARPEGQPIGLRYALSDLPCLSARDPLHRRARRLRGGKRLVVSSLAADITPAEPLRGDTLLAGAEATPHALRDAMGLRRHRRVRIDAHGVHDHDDPAKSWLALSPAGSDGHLEAKELQEMDLSACGTLMLRACESGMAQRIGRDERIGFARAAFHAGAASVVAARWVAARDTAAVVLDGFERYARYLPRDLALQRAQLHARTVGPGNESPIPPGHPARWACWTLYGDSDFQTRAGRVWRWLRQHHDERGERG